MYTMRRGDVTKSISLQSLHYTYPRVHVRTTLSWHLYPQLPIYLRIISLNLLFLFFTAQSELSSYFR